MEIVASWKWLQGTAGYPHLRRQSHLHQTFTLIEVPNSQSSLVSISHLRMDVAPLCYVFEWYGCVCRIFYGENCRGSQFLLSSSSSSSSSWLKKLVWFITFDWVSTYQSDLSAAEKIGSHEDNRSGVRHSFHPRHHHNHHYNCWHHHHADADADAADTVDATDTVYADWCWLILIDADCRVA